MTRSGVVAVGARSAAEADLDAVGRLAVAARKPLVAARGGAVLLATDPRTGDERGQLALALVDDSRLLVVGTLDGVVVGYLLAGSVATPGGLLLAGIDELFVEPEARQVGVGAAMLGDALAWAGDCGCDGVDAVTLPGDRATKNFFESHGLVARAIIAHRSLVDDSERRP